MFFSFRITAQNRLEMMRRIRPFPAPMSSTRSPGPTPEPSTSASITRRSIAEFVGRFLAATGDRRKVIADPQALYYGAKMGGRGIAPGAHPRVGPTRFEEWYKRPAAGR